MGADPVTERLAMVLHEAIEACNPDLLVSCYSQDAEIRIIDREHPPSAPLTVRGRDAITRYYGEVCAREPTHHIDEEVVSDNHITLTEAGHRPDGSQVVSMDICELDNGKIFRQTKIEVADG
jgi:predicted SnoaL-like aldol condensation-catalyzing enzyme